jgi:hypothetical protein
MQVSCTGTRIPSAVLRLLTLASRLGIVLPDVARMAQLSTFDEDGGLGYPGPRALFRLDSCDRASTVVSPDHPNVPLSVVVFSAADLRDRQVWNRTASAIYSVAEFSPDLVEFGNARIERAPDPTAWAKAALEMVERSGLGRASFCGPGPMCMRGHIQLRRVQAPPPAHPALEISLHAASIFNLGMVDRLIGYFIGLCETLAAASGVVDVEPRIRPAPSKGGAAKPSYWLRYVAADAFPVGDRPDESDAQIVRTPSGGVLLIGSPPIASWVPPGTTRI